MATRFLIDAHVHLNNYHEATRRPTQENVDELFAKMDECGVDHAFVITSYRVDLDRPSVEELLSHLSKNPRISIIEGLRWRGDERTDLFCMEERIRDGWIRGIKLYPGYDKYAINDPSLESVFRIAEKHSIPVVIHTGDTYSKGSKVRQAHPLLVDDIAVDYPNVKFVVAHLGNPWLQDTAEVLYKNDNVYADVSGLTLGEFTLDFERYIAHRVKEMVMYMGDPGKQLIYGTDWPLVKMKPYLKFVGELALSEAQLENVMWKTAATLFRVGEEELEQAKAARLARIEKT
jgi:predicted TIM-barrel fold metal-dependent hydrolase